VKFDLPPVESAGDVATVMGAVTMALASGSMRTSIPGATFLPCSGGM